MDAELPAQDLTKTVTPPPRIAQYCKQDRHGRYVPWFVAWVKGEPDFRVIDGPKIGMAHTLELCWVCGQPRGRMMTFPVGPMCTVNRTSAEPPSHKECALYSARVCPFLTRPHMKRREANLPEGATDPAGYMISRNPAVTALWTTRSYRLFPDGQGRALFQMGEPEDVMWLREGRLATRAEVLDSIDSGCPALRDMAASEGPEAMAELDRYLERARKYLPAASVLS